MKVLAPLAITEAMLTSSITEPDTGETAWDADTAYVVGDQAILTSTHTVYERLVAGTTAASPDEDTTNWTAIGPTNKWRMFDLLRNTGSATTWSILVEITPGRRVDAIALIGLDADQVAISVRSGGDAIYVATDKLGSRDVLSWYDYFFQPFSTKSTVAHFDLPPTTDAEISVTVSKTDTSATVTCGGLLIGTAVDLGETVQSSVSDVLNFSTIDRDEFGNSILVQRRNVPKTSQTVVCDRKFVNRVRAVRDQLNAVPAFWSWLDDQDDNAFDAGVIMGVYKQFSITFDQPDTATITLDIEEV